MIVFYSQLINAEFGELSAEDSRHCYKVLRKKIGDNITVLDGKGNIHQCKIIEIERNNVTFTIQSYKHSEPDIYHPTIGMSLLKNTNRFEWFLEKATEIGVQNIQPLECNRTLKGKFRKDRAEAIVISAMKQSMRAYFPILNEVKVIKDVLSNTNYQHKYICHYALGNPHLLDTLQVGIASFILIGPEGDFTDEELSIAHQNGWQQVNISESRLRTETAGITACQIVALKNRG
ncbi:MAG: RsmE family RNA methyltransferase [Saprospiraceae bacterium]